MRKRWVAGLLFLILIDGAALRMQGFTEPWGHGARGRLAANSAFLAHNILRYGLWEHRLAPVFFENPRAPRGYSLYITHPPFYFHAIALSFLLFGESEPSARLAMMPFTLGAIAAMYVLGRRLMGRRAGLLAAAYTACVPMAVYAGPAPDSQGSHALLVAVLTFGAYAAWLDRPTPRRLMVVVLGLLAGTLSEWTIFYAVPVLAGHMLIVRRRPRAALAIGAAGTGLFAALVVYVSWASGDWLIVLTRTARHAINDFTYARWFGSVSAIWKDHYTPVFLAVLAAALLAWILRCAAGKSDRGLDFVALLFAFGLSHVLIASRGAEGHFNFHNLLVPSVALAAAWATESLLRVAWPVGSAAPAVGSISPATRASRPLAPPRRPEGPSSRSRWRLAAGVSGGLLFAGLSCAGHVQSLVLEEEATARPLPGDAGLELRAAAPDADVLFTETPYADQALYYSGKDLLIAAWSVSDFFEMFDRHFPGGWGRDRRLQFAFRTQNKDLRSLREGPAGAARDQAEAWARLFVFLDTHFPSRVSGAFTVFDLARDTLDDLAARRAGLPSPSGVTVEEKGGRLRVSWDPVPGMEDAEYRVYVGRGGRLYGPPRRVRGAREARIEMPPEGGRFFFDVTVAAADGLDRPAGNGLPEGGFQVIDEERRVRSKSFFLAYLGGMVTLFLLGALGDRGALERPRPAG